MNTYDPADRILYVHLAQHPVAPPGAHEECHRLAAGYANASLRARLGEPRAADTRPPLVLLPGGSTAADASGPAKPGAAPGLIAPGARRRHAERAMERVTGIEPAWPA
jgi:hypothetical protein